MCISSMSLISGTANEGQHVLLRPTARVPVSQRGGFEAGSGGKPWPMQPQINGMRLRPPGVVRISRVFPANPMAARAVAADRAMHTMQRVEMSQVSQKRL